MKRIKAERNIVIVLFVLVLISFSFADRDSKKLDRLYTSIETKINQYAAAKKLQQQPQQQITFRQ